MQASNLRIEEKETTFTEGNDGQSDEVLQEKKVIEKHPFSEPWEDSDLILVVEDETFHVHRQILSIHSPVFKAMLNSVFKEATATEIPLPGKKACEVLDFLKFLYLKENEGITLNKMGHLLKLADEYQAQGVLDLCVKSLTDFPKAKENAVKILFLATHTEMVREDHRLDDVRERCLQLIKNMILADIRLKSDYKNLDKDTMERVFVERTNRLETFVRELYPQFIGLVEYCLYFALKHEASSVKKCPQHFPEGGFYPPSLKATVGLPQRIATCSVCRQMISQLISSSGSSNTRVYGGDYHFDRNVISMIQDFKTILPSSLFSSLFGFKKP